MPFTRARCWYLTKARAVRWISLDPVISRFSQPTLLLMHQVILRTVGFYSSFPTQQNLAQNKAQALLAGWDVISSYLPTPLSFHQNLISSLKAKDQLVFFEVWRRFLTASPLHLPLWRRRIDKAVSSSPDDLSSLRPSRIVSARKA